jgi:hypothetical protein
MDHMERQAGARARFALMDTATLERMWIHEERVDWAEAALRAELTERDVDPDALALRRSEEPPVRPAWLKLEAVPVAALPSRRPTAAMPLRWFIAVFAVLAIWSIALTWFAGYSGDATAETRRVVPAVLGAITGGSVFLRWLRVDFRYVFSGVWLTGLGAATLVFLCLPHAAPTASLFDEVNATTDSHGTDGVERRAIAMASTIVRNWQTTNARLEAHMAADVRATVVNDTQLADPATRQRVRDALGSWRGDLVNLDLTDERALRGLSDAEASVIAEGGRPADSITRSIANLAASRKLLAPMRAAASTVIDARQAIVDFFETHTLNADDAAAIEYRKLYQGRWLAEENARRVWASILAQQAKAPGAAH